MTQLVSVATYDRKFLNPAYTNGDTIEVSKIFEAESPAFAVYNVKDIEITSSAVPLPLKVISLSLLILSLAFLTTFILALFGLNLINGFVGLVGFTSLFGLYKVSKKIENVI